jgi:hypothetical protein
MSSLQKYKSLHNYEEIVVRATSLDAYFSRHALPCSLLKIDVQGGELDVLLGARGILTTDRPMVVFEYEDGTFGSDDERSRVKQEMLRFFSDLRYHLHALPWELPVMYMPRLTFGGFYEGDVLALPY